MEVVSDIVSPQEFVETVYRKSHSQSSRKNATDTLNVFQKFCRSKYKANIDEVIIELQKESILPYKLLNDFIAYMDNRGNAATSIRTRTSSVRQFMIINNIAISEYEFNARVKMPTVLREKRQPLSHELVAKMLAIMPLEVKVFILMMISTLRRPQELVQLRVRDIDFDNKPPVVTIPAKISKNRTMNHTFLTQECKELLLAYLGERLNKLDDFIFPSDAEHTSTIVGKYQLLFRYHMNKLPALNTKKEQNPTRHKISLYSFKDFAFTRVQRLTDAEFARELKGDKTTEYSNLTLEEKMQMYLECEPELTVSNADAVRKQVQESQVEMKKQIEEQQREIDNLRTKNDFANQAVLLKDLAHEVALKAIGEYMNKRKERVKRRTS